MINNKSCIWFFFSLLWICSAFSQTTEGLKFSEGLAAQKIILKDKKVAYGFVNHKGKVIIPHQYDTVFAPFAFGVASVAKNKKAGVIDKKGKVIIAFEYKEIGEINKSHVAVKDEKGLWGFCNFEGEKIIPAAFQNYRFSPRGKFIVQKDGKWGIIDENGEVLLDYHYKNIQNYTEKNFHAYKVTTWNVKNLKNETILSLEMDSLRYTGEKLYRYSLIGKKGLVDEKGKQVIGPDYEEIANFKYGLAKVKKEKYGVITPAGKIIVHPLYDEVIVDSLHIRVKIVEKEGEEYKSRWGLIDHKGNVLIKPKYSALSAYSEGMMAAMRADGTWGYVSPTGSTEIIFRYAFAEDFKNGIARVKVPYSLMKRDLFALIDKEGDYIITPANYEHYLLGVIKIERGNKTRAIVPIANYTSYEKGGKDFIRVGKNGFYGMINSNGTEIVPPIYNRVSDASDNGLIVVEKDGKSGVVDSKGNFTMKMTNRFEKVFGFKEGFSKMQLKGKFGFMDMHGDIWISAQYPDAGEMSDSMVNVIIRGKWAFVDHKENLKVQPYYEEVFPFKNGKALVKENGKWNFVNKEGKQLHNIDFDKIEETASGKYLLFTGSKVGMADKRGREMLAAKYEQIEEVGKNMVMVKKNGLWGVLDHKENFIIPIEHDVIIYEPLNNTFVTGVIGKQEKIYIK